MAATTEITELVHLCGRFAIGGITCGEASRGRVTERLSEATCPRCRYAGDPVPRTRGLQVEAAHAEALEMNAQYGPTQEVEMTSGYPQPTPDEWAQMEQQVRAMNEAAQRRKRDEKAARFQKRLEVAKAQMQQEATS